MRRSTVLAYATLGVMTVASAALAPAAADVDLVWSSVDAGGGRSAGGDLQLVGTFGEADAGVMSSGPFALTGGFLAYTPLPCVGDTDGNASIDVDDLINVILDWGTSGSANGGDVDGSGTVDVDDLIGVILGWGICP